MISTKFEGLSNILKDIENIEDKLESPFNSIDNEIENIAINSIKEKTPVVTGHLRDGTKSRNISGKDIEIYNDVEYGIYVNAKNEFFYIEEEDQNKIEEIISDNIVKE